MDLDASQRLAVQVSERTMSVLSISGSLLIIGTFWKWHYFRKPINRLVFYASFGNIMANIATLMSLSALPSNGEQFSSLCEFQGILIQWFLMADSLWVFCMALNVLLVFFRGHDQRDLRRLEKWYALFSYGVPGTIAFVYIIINHTSRHRIIGPATIWCWVSSEVEWMRIAFFYGPVWIIIFLTLSIYVVTGYRIFKRRAQLHSFSKHEPEHCPTSSCPHTTDALTNIKVETEMRVESHSVLCEDLEMSSAVYISRHSSFASTKKLSTSIVEHQVQDEQPSSNDSRESAHPEQIQGSDLRYDRYNAAVFTSSHPHAPLRNADTANITHKSIKGRQTNSNERSAAAWGYFKVAFLMFAALFIVWVPSSINRVQQFSDKKNPIFGLNLASALVLPLQGFWNSIIYMSTTWPECKRAWQESLNVTCWRGRSRRTGRDDAAASGTDNFSLTS